MMNCSLRLLATPEPIGVKSRLALIAVAGLLLGLSSAKAFEQDSAPQRRDTITVEGTVRNPAGEPVADATVLIEGKEHSNSYEMKTKADGSFVISALSPNTYILRAEKPGWRVSVSSPLVLLAGEKKR